MPILIGSAPLLLGMAIMAASDVLMPIAWWKTRLFLDAAGATLVVGGVITVIIACVNALS